jgi:hypothetical protein
VFLDEVLNQIGVLKNRIVFVLWFWRGAEAAQIEQNQFVFSRERLLKLTKGMGAGAEAVYAQDRVTLAVHLAMEAGVRCAVVGHLD